MIQSKIIICEPSSNPGSIDASRKPLSQADINDKCENFWKMQCADLMKEKDILKNQVQNLKKMVKEQSGIRQAKIELELQTVTEKLAAERAQYKDEVENLKAELNRKKLEISQLRKSNRNSTNSNHKHPNMNSVFKKLRISEANNENLSSQIDTLRVEKYSMMTKVMKTMKITRNLFGK